MVKIVGVNERGEPVDIYYHMPDDDLSPLIKYLLKQDNITLVSIEKEKEE